ncbi:Phosphomevalonate kinase [Ananas comosus]|uniref:Phosphomevalonate kinase n=1 Tax=Ananas comosus TaxID=4615 RepID=A0A199VKK6_ANACO|nr:Phosphomevalonate kinase [Ananas comosus]
MAERNAKPEVAKTGLAHQLQDHICGCSITTLSWIVTLPSTDEKATAVDLDLLKKVGSGFDVSAAVYGSQRYIGFSEVLFHTVPSSAPFSSDIDAMGGKHLPDVVADILKQKWNHENFQFLAPLLTLLLGEPGTGGSSTPSMVGSVKKWQKSEPQKSLETWQKLGIANSMLETQLKQLSKFAEDHWETYKHTIGTCSGHAHGKELNWFVAQWLEQAVDQFGESIVKSLLGARNAFVEIRSHMRQMGNAAGVPVKVLFEKPKPTPGDGGGSGSPPE